MEFKKIAVIGLGYIGLPTAAMFASRKLNVLGVDINQHAVDTINQGKVHIVEPDLDIAVHSAVSEGFLKASIIPEPADAFIIAVPTPFKENHKPDLSYIEAASKAIAPIIEKGNLVILESTSPVGATEKMANWLAEARPDLSFPQSSGVNADVNIAHCPERVLPGHVMRELIENDRIIGGMTTACAEKSVALYKAFVTGDCITTNARTAEMAKLTENSFRDVNIAFANELSMICDEQDIDVWELIKLANRHPRVNILQPGCGVGGHCIAVDPWFIVDSSPELAKIIRTAREVNEYKPEWVISKVFEAIGQYLSDNPKKSAAQVKVACFGIAFKPDIDDLRESPALQIVESLVQKHPGPLMVVEPNIESLTSSSLKECELVSYDTAISSADIVVMLVDHAEFKAVATPNRSGQRLIDTRGIWGGSCS